MNRRPPAHRSRKMKRRELIHALREREDHVHALAGTVVKLHAV